MEESCLRFKVEKRWSNKKRKSFSVSVFNSALFCLWTCAIGLWKVSLAYTQERKNTSFNAIDRGRHHDGYGPDHSSDRKFARIQPVKQRGRASRRNWSNARPIFCRHTQPCRLTYTTFFLFHVLLSRMLLILNFWLLSTAKCNTCMVHLAPQFRLYLCQPGKWIVRVLNSAVESKHSKSPWQYSN